MTGAAADNRILLRGGRILDPAAERDEIADLWIEGDRISRAAAGEEVGDARVIEASGCWVVPGFVDLHTHLREPGQ